MYMIQSQQEYDELLEEVAQNIEQLGEQPRTAANVLLYAFEKYDEDDLVMLTNAEPFSSGRVMPGSVFEHTHQEYPYNPEDGDTYRDVAVSVLVRDLEEQLEQLQG